MTERRNEIKHFAHEHTLIFKESEEIPFCCNACGLCVLSSPSYICTVQGCSFYLHEPCARLPDRLSFRGCRYHTHDLRLRAKPDHEDCRCSKCGNLCKNFTYHCDECDEFDLDPLCGHPLDIKIKHVSHKEHPMVAICKESLLLCDVCGRKHNGFFFHCHQCNFLIHQDCASLPAILRVGRHHDHHLSFMYSDALVATFSSSHRCIICEKDVSLLFGAYICLACLCMAHADCAVSEMDKNRGKVYNMPPLDDAFLSWITCAVEITTPKSDDETMLEKYHPAHSLISNNETAHESVCNACIKPMAPPYYSCSQSTCDFLLHKFCADFPLVILELFGRSRWDLVFPRCDEFFSLFFCILCSRLGNGFGYSDGSSDMVHLECVLAPPVINHDSHKQHPLISSGEEWLEKIISCCDQINPRCYDLYCCTQCRFSAHIHCVLLPKTVTHKFDKHPLTLITDSSAVLDLGDDHFCEFCEKDINSSYWFYRCIECEHSFHVGCIPSTGRYSRIKFGGTVLLPNCHHPNCHGDDRLTLVRMLSVGSQTCGFCNEIIKGFKDGMALHCAKCDFWIHFKCGFESSGATVSEPYQDMSSLLNIYSVDDDVEF